MLQLSNSSNFSLPGPSLRPSVNRIFPLFSSSLFLSCTWYRVGTPPFQHISLDPLGVIRVLMTGSHSGKLSPLNICDLNTSDVAVESMVGVKAEHVYLALQRL